MVDYEPTKEIIKAFKNKGIQLSEGSDLKVLIADIEADKVAHVLVKDMSRIGRDDLQTGFYTEVMFRQYHVHFVAIANSVDSDDQNINELILRFPM